MYRFALAAALLVLVVNATYANEPKGVPKPTTTKRTLLERDFNSGPVGAVGRILTSNGQTCSGTLINSCLVLTAGHCLKNNDGSPKPGLAFTARTADGQVLRTPLDLIYSPYGERPDVWGGLLSNDIAVAKLREKVRAGKSVVMPKFIGEETGVFGLLPLGRRDLLRSDVNYCLAGYSNDIGQGEKATIDKNIQFDAFLGDDGRDKFGIEYRAEMWNGASGGPVFQCPIDRRTGKPSLEAPRIVAVNTFGPGHPHPRMSKEMNRVRSQAGGSLVAGAEDVIKVILDRVKCN